MAGRRENVDATVVNMVFQALQSHVKRNVWRKDVLANIFLYGADGS